MGALLLAAEGNLGHAVEIYTLATCYPFIANSHWCEAVVGRQITTVAATLPHAVVVTSQEQGRARDLWKTADYLLTALASNGSSVLPND